MSSSVSLKHRSLGSQAPRKIENFQDPREFLMAIHDAIKEHQEVFIATGMIHGNINTNTVYIGCKASNIHTRGFLIDSPTIDPMFQSVNILSKTVLERKHTRPIDYLDDLESFYYIIAWVSMAYSAPGVRLPVSQYPFLLSSWAADPASRESALEKEAMLFGEGFACSVNGEGFAYGNTLREAEVFESLLECFHSILKARYNEKLVTTGVPTPQEMISASSSVYDSIFKKLKISVRLLDHEMMVLSDGR